MISVYFLWFDKWTLQERKTAKVRNYFVSTYYLLLPCLFSSARFLNMCKPRTTFYLLWGAVTPGMAFYASRTAHLPSLLRMMDAGWLGSIRSEMFLQIKFIVFQDCPTKQLSFLSGHSAPYNQLLIQPVLLVPKCYFA